MKKKQKQNKKQQKKQEKEQQQQQQQQQEQHFQHTNHVPYFADKIDVTPQQIWERVPGKRFCEWKSLELFIDSSALRGEIQAAALGVDDPWITLTRDPGISIWRVTKYRATPWPAEEYGHFYDADAFIVLNTQWLESETPVYNIHIWVGKYAQKEEYEAVLVKGLELDWKLGYAGVVHREVQSRETDLFRSYFNPMTIWKGDAESRLRSLKGETYPARLLRFYKPSAHRPFTCMKEVPIQKEYLDSDLIFVMDIGHQIYQWNGDNCNPPEVSQAITYCQKLRADRGMTSDYEMVDEEYSQEHYFNFYFKEGDNTVSQLDSDDDTNAEVSRNVSTLRGSHKPQLHQVITQGQQASFRLLKEGEISHQDLDKQKVVIVDMKTECYVWISTTAAQEKRLALQYAHDYLKQTDYPLIPVIVEMEGRLSADFNRALNRTSRNGNATTTR